MHNRSGEDTFFKTRKKRGTVKLEKEFSESYQVEYKSCASKKKYKNKTTAITVAQVNLETKATLEKYTQLTVYHCSYCDAFHLTRSHVNENTNDVAVARIFEEEFKELAETVSYIVFDAEEQAAKEQLDLIVFCLNQFIEKSHPESLRVPVARKMLKKIQQKFMGRSFSQETS